MTNNINQIMAWQLLEDGVDPESAFTTKVAPITTPLEDFEKLSYRVLEPGYKGFITDIWVDQQANCLYDDIAAQKIYLSPEKAPNAESIFKQQAKVNDAAERFFLYLANQEIARLNNKSLRLDSKKIRQAKHNALRFFARAEDLPITPKPADVKRLVDKAVKSALEFSHDARSKKNQNLTTAKPANKTGALKKSLGHKGNPPLPSRYARHIN